MAKKNRNNLNRSGFGRLLHNTPALVAIIAVAVVGMIALGFSFADTQSVWYYNSTGVTHNNGQYLKAYNEDGWDNHQTCGGSGTCGFMWLNPTITFSTSQTTNVKVCVNAANEPNTVNDEIVGIVTFNKEPSQTFDQFGLTNTPTDYCHTFSRPAGNNQTVSIWVNAGGSSYPWIHSVSFTVPMSSKRPTN